MAHVACCPRVRAFRGPRGPWRLAVVVLAAVASRAPRAGAYCRRSTCAGQPATVCTPARAGDCGVPARWSDAPISYEVGELPANAPADLAAALDRAFDRWRAADCGGGRHPSFALAPQAAAAPGASGIARGQAGFSDEPPAVTRGTLSVTRLRIAPDTGEILRARMVFHANALRPYGEGAFFDSIALHEAGHFLGLAHSADPSAAMFAGVYDGFDPRVTLDADDVAAICDAYPPRGMTAAAGWWRSASGVAMLLMAAPAVAAMCAVLRRTSFGARLSARR